MEEVLEQMKYANARDIRFIGAIRSYCKTLSIDTSHLPDCRDTIQCNTCGQYRTLDHFYFSKRKTPPYKVGNFLGKRKCFV